MLARSPSPRRSSCSDVSATRLARPKRFSRTAVNAELAIDPAKRAAWWWYLANVHTRHACDAFLVVVTPDPQVAEWAARPIRIGQPGTLLTPLVIGPEQVPIVRDASKAVAVPELAVLSAVVHGRSDAAEDIARAAFEAVRHLDGDQLAIYTDVVIASLRASARIVLEALMTNGTYEYQSDFAKRYFAQGKAAGRTEGEALGRAEGEALGRAEGDALGMALSVIRVLESRGIEVPEDVRTEVVACNDSARLAEWIARAVTVASAIDLLQR